MTERHTFHDVPAHLFPFKIEFFDQAGEVVHTIEVDGPGGVQIPGLTEEHGPVSTRITFADGTVMAASAPMFKGDDSSS